MGMRIVYCGLKVMTVCEITLNRLRINEPQNVERVVGEDDDHIFTRDRSYEKSKLTFHK